jgi:mannose-6-phosphate isomerase-like protein (cupin superfamily)
MDPINLKEKLSLFTATWTPKEIAYFDDYKIFLAKLEDDFIFHAHEDEDEVFLVIEGRFKMEYRDREVWVETGEMVVVPKGVEHKPCAPEPCSVMVIEKKITDHTGGVDDPRRKETFEQI